MQSISFFVLVVLLMSSVAQANVRESIFQSVKVIDEQKEDKRLYFLPLGRIKKDTASGRLLPAEYKRLNGQFESVVWELTGGLSLKEARAKVETFVTQPRFKMLFQCEKRDCGESFAWANSIFQQPNLYGNDRAQAMWVLKDVGTRRYHLFYLIERPNRRIYFYEETLTLEDQPLDAEFVSAHLNNTGRVVVGTFPLKDVVQEAQAIAETIQSIVSGLPAHSKGYLLVLHRHGKALKADPQTIIHALEQVLAKQGITQFQVQDVANLAPNSDAETSCWLEWVNPSWEP